MLGLRVSADDMARIDALAGRLAIGTRHGIARAALRLGLDAIEKDPAILLSGRAVPARVERGVMSAAVPRSPRGMAA